jgi:hypothetical protein
MRRNMTNRNTLLWTIAGAVALFLSAGQQYARADLIDNVTVDTSGLPSSPGSEIVFFLTDGSATGDDNNTATLTGFGFGGGSAGAVDIANTGGGVTGDMTSGVSITDSSFGNTLAQFFAAGTSLSFLLDLTTNVDAGPTPDQFGFAILDPTGNPIPTSDPTGDDNLLVVNIDSSSPGITSYSDLVTVTPVGAVATPEPSSVLVLAICLFGLLLAYRRHRSADGALESPAPNMVDLFLHGARERHDAHRGQDEILLG